MKSEKAMINNNIGVTKYSLTSKRQYDDCCASQKAEREVAE